MGEGSGGDATVIPFGERAGSGDGERPDPPPLTLNDAIARSDALPGKLSARSVPSLMQILCFLLGIGLALTAFQHVPGLTVLLLCFAFWMAFFMIVNWRLMLALTGIWLRLRGRAAIQSGPDMETDDDLPVYSVLAALRDEAGMMDQLAESLSALDWPEDRLDILLLIEADDEPTRAAAAAADFPPGTRILTVPPGRPLTKPRALNHGLAHAVGEYVTIYDAEDRPAPGQLREAHAAFMQASPDVLCIQAPLVASNGAANWISSQWSLEYAVQFGLYVPALSAFGHPVMLGGTSNHFRRSDLMLFGGWDAWNVTEDADLGIRASRLGGRTVMIGAPTRESAPEQFSVWLSQRGRWAKGFIQTWLVCMRMPFSLLFELGFVRWFSLQMTLGGSVLNAFLYGPMTLFIAAGLMVPAVRIDPVSFALFGYGWAASAVGDICAPGRWSFSRVLAMATRPLYWPLQTLAALNAIYGLAVKPFFWAKTPHEPESETPHKAWPAGSSHSPS